MSYVELHSHSAFSFLDGASLPDELVAAAAERGHSALALTDHDSVSGSMEFAQAADEVGCAPSTARRSPSSTRRGTRARPRAISPCWSATRGAGRNLCRLLTRAHAHTRVYAAERRRGGRALTRTRVADGSRVTLATSRPTPRGWSA